MKRKLITIILASVLLTSYAPSQGQYPTTSQSLWQLWHYKCVVLPTEEPLCWTPFKSYELICYNTTITQRDNVYWFTITKDLNSMVYEDAIFNITHAPRYKGKAKKRLRKIYLYCAKTQYVFGKKYARNVFEERQGDCAGIAAAFYVMCKRNRIPCKYVIGWCEYGCHAWNRVKVGKKWYWIDATHGKWLSRKQFPNRSVMEMW